MGKVKRQQIAALLIPLLISTLQWTAFGDSEEVDCDLTSRSSRCKISTPQECARKCRENEKPKICYYRFSVEHYASLTAACDYGNQTASQCIRADGIEKSMLTINRQYPGPEIHVCKGDRVIVDLINEASGTGLTIHWHGLFQKGSQYYDGVPLLTQCPVAESNSFRYDFIAANSGTHMYHSHSSIQMMEGMIGSFIVDEPDSENPYADQIDDDSHRITISDMFIDEPLSHLPGRRHGNNTGQTANNFLINGNGINTDPNAVDVAETILPKFTVKRGKVHRFRLQNLCSTVCLSTLSIENHDLTVIATDGEYVKATRVNEITTATGERVDFLVNATEKVGSYWITLRGEGECADNKVYQLALLEYEGSKGPQSPQPTFDDLATKGVTFNPTNITGCLNHSPDSKCVYQLENAAGEQPPELRKAKPDVQVVLVFGFYFPDDLEEFSGDSYHPFFASPGGGITLWSVVNNISFADPPAPPISQKEGYQSLTQQPCPSANCTGSQVVSVPSNAVVEILIYDGFPATGLYHPFHLHGYSFAMLKQGYHDPATANPMAEARKLAAEVHKEVEKGEIKNCARKDTIVIPEGGYSVIRFLTNNPGWWLLHCHFTWHTVSGMDVVVHVGKQSELPPIPKGFPRCGNFLPPIKCSSSNRG